MARILSISSLVPRGRVGNSIAVPVLEAMGHEVWSLPTILLSARPGLGTIAKHEMPAELIAEFVETYEADGVLPTIDGILSGYLPSAGHVEAVASAIRSVKSANPAAIYLCDPVMGDGDRGLYIAEDAAEGIRAQLLDQADVLTPNLFELEWLADQTSDDPADLAASLPPETVVVTSSSEADDIENILVTGEEATAWRGERLPGIPNGTGDLFAALLLGHLLNGDQPPSAFRKTCDQLQSAARASSGCDVLQIAGFANT